MAIETRTRISNEAYGRLALLERDRQWELWDGRPRQRPGGTAAANSLCMELSYLVFSQLDRAVHHIRTNSGRLRHARATYLIPDVFVFPRAFITPRLRRDDVLEVYDQHVPFVAQVWSSIAGNSYVKAKLAIYKERGDLEIWLIHPHERMLTSWVWQPDGSYEETVYREGVVRPVALPGVEIDLATLFAR